MPAAATAADPPRPAGLRAELERQVDVLVALGYPALSGTGEGAFRALLAPLAERLGDVPAAGDGRVPFVVVLGADLAPPEQAIELVELGGRRGVTGVDAADLARFVPVPALAVPDVPAWLATDVDAGADLRSVTPDDALPRITAAGRSPLTLQEGLGLLAQDPGTLRAGTPFSMLGSRCGDRRVTALWVRRDGAPRLGWCWAGAPHTWLGSASLASRLA